MMFHVKQLKNCVLNYVELVKFTNWTKFCPISEFVNFIKINKSLKSFLLVNLVFAHSAYFKNVSKILGIRNWFLRTSSITLKYQAMVFCMH